MTADPSRSRRDRLARRVRAGAVGAAGVEHGVGMREAAGVWGAIALQSFGGPAGQIAVMHRYLVEERRWISEDRFLHALNYCMLLPGPEAQQLATYIGWLMHGTTGGVLAGLLFVLPGFVAILTLSIAYAAFAGLGAIDGLFFGLQAAVVAVVVDAVGRIGRRALKTRAQVVLAVAAFVAIFFAEVAFPVLVLAAAVVGYVGDRVRPGLFIPAPHGSRAPGPSQHPSPEPFITHDGAAMSPDAARSALRAAAIALALWSLPVVVALAAAGPGHVYADIATLFSTSAVVTFGGAYAVLAYISQVAVNAYGWLQPGEMLTGLGMAETTPGPLVMVVQYVGFLAAYRNPGGLPPLAAGVVGSVLASWVTFAPCFFFIFAGAPFIERLRGNRSLGTALSAVTAAVVGVVANLAVWFAIHTAFDRVDVVRRFGIRLLVPEPASANLAGITITVAAMVAILRLRAPIIPTLAACAGAGLLLAGVFGL